LSLTTFLLNPNSSYFNANGVWCSLVQSGAGSRFFAAEKNCSTFWIFLLAKNELLKKAGLFPQPDHFF
jgi:hypothetical protein